ncbi:MAG: M1 family metallopeptidase [Flavisolibacter sp.]
MRKVGLSFCFLLLIFLSHGQDIDVLHYRFQIELSDLTDSIYGQADVDYLILKPQNYIALDLTQSNHKGMTVQAVRGAHITGFTQKNNQLIISLDHNYNPRKQTLRIMYSGIPSDGLIISNNKFQERTFFADNWPDRAHNWIPCHDVPFDKASFEFIVIAPAHYNVVSNGYKKEERAWPRQKKLTHWIEEVPLSTKVMVIGAARMAVKEFPDSPDSIPITAWVYPQDSAKGFYDYSVAPSILKFFSSFIGPFPYNKLANVQSKTIFGGMENASAIFYSEQSVTGTRIWEDIIAHEIAHQWFGDMVSEKSFSHLWLSEGFATYLADLYISFRYGADSAISRLEKERNEVIKFNQINHHCIVDTSSNLLSLLNVNSYQKGAWVLHMLRNETGDSLFQKIIRTFYEQYKGRNADSRDFELVVKNVCRQDYRWFFDQWLYRPGIPEINLGWKFYTRAGPNANHLQLNFKKKGSFIFHRPLEIMLIYEDGTNEKKSFDVNKENSFFTVRLKKKPSRIVLDPGKRLLFIGTSQPL